MKLNLQTKEHGWAEIIAFLIVVVAITGIILGIMFGWPVYRVWQQGLSGKAKLKEAEYSRQIMVQEAQAKLDSASKLADAEIARARGVAAANEIIGESLKGNEAYLHYLWIHNLAEGKNEVIYVPTEANFPIMEAGRFNRLDAKEEKEK